MSDRDEGSGKRILRAVAYAALALLVLYLLFFHIFPRVEAYLEDPTLGAPATAQVTAPLLR